jgi:hypothetical protein
MSYQNLTIQKGAAVDAWLVTMSADAKVHQKLIRVAAIVVEKGRRAADRQTHLMGGGFR